MVARGEGRQRMIGVDDDDPARPIRGLEEPRVEQIDGTAKPERVPPIQKPRRGGRRDRKGVDQQRHTRSRRECLERVAKGVGVRGDSVQHLR